MERGAGPYLCRAPDAAQFVGERSARESGPERDDARRYVLDTFERAYERFVAAGDVGAVPGAEKAITQLRESGVEVASTTGFSRSTQDRLLEALGWADLADSDRTRADAGLGRPYPDMILAALVRTGTDDVRAVAVVGDTALVLR